MNQTEIYQVLEEKGAVMRGHFRLSSGRHSNLFAQKFRVLEHPGIAHSLGEHLGEMFDRRFDVVASPAIGALVLGFCVALSGHARFVFAERVDGEMTFRRGFRIEPGERVLVVEDVVTTGGSAREVVDLVQRSGGEVVGVGALLDRADAARSEIGAPLKALLTLHAESWDPEGCPLCEQGLPLDDPGSRRA
ncbi:MAG: orotate phosphoribosyltransferase [Actinomycetota bacterium]